MESKAEKKFDLAHDSYWWDFTYAHDTHTTYEEFEQAASDKAKSCAFEVGVMNLRQEDQWTTPDCGRENRLFSNKPTYCPIQAYRHCRRCGKKADLSLVTPLKRELRNRPHPKRREKYTRLYMCMECSHSGMGFMAMDFAEKCMLNNCISNNKE